MSKAERKKKEGAKKQVMKTQVKSRKREKKKTVQNTIVKILRKGLGAILRGGGFLGATFGDGGGGVAAADSLVSFGLSVAFRSGFIAHYELA